MTSVIAFGALSGLGEGEAAVRVPDPGEAPTIAIARDEELVRAGLTRPFVARAQGPFDDPAEDRALTLLDRAANGCAEMLDEVIPGWRKQRVGLCLGTSSGGLRSCERLFDGEDLEAIERVKRTGQFTYFSSVSRLAAVLELGPSRASLVLGACASSTLAIGLGTCWLDDGRCDLVVAGGYDAVGVFVAAGFEAIRATSKDGVMRPFCVDRDGLVLGEGAGLVALVRGRHPRALGYVRGFGASSDAVHLTAPDRTGRGLARAAQTAMVAAGSDLAIGLVSAHGTATDFNDAAESRAIGTVLESSPGEGTYCATVHAYKPQIGHTLGAAGVLEALAALFAMRRGVLPATAFGAGVLGDSSSGLARPLPSSLPGTARTALKLSAAFGGANAALVLSLEPPEGESASKIRPVYVSRGEHVTDAPPLDELAAMTSTAKDKLGRTDQLSRLALFAVGKLVASMGSLEGAGIVLGHGLATHESNALFWAGIKRRGASLAEPRRFPFTSPNAACGECSIAYRLTGPGLAVGLGAAGGLEALSVAADLVRAGHADRVVVVACDDVGVASSGFVSGPSGAVAVLVSAGPQGAGYTQLVDSVIEVGHGSGLPDGPFPPAHAALIALCEAVPPALLETGPSWGVFGRVRLRTAP